MLYVTPCDVSQFVTYQLVTAQNVTYHCVTVADCYCIKSLLYHIVTGGWGVMKLFFYSGYPSNSQNKIQESRVPILKKKAKRKSLMFV